MIQAGCTGSITSRPADAGPIDAASIADGQVPPPTGGAQPADAGELFLADAGHYDAGAVDAGPPDADMHDSAVGGPACGAGAAGDEAGLLAHRSGFGSAVTGGAGGRHIVLESLDGSAFVAAISGAELKWVSFAPGLSGEIVISSDVDVGSNTPSTVGVDLILTV